MIHTWWRRLGDRQVIVPSLAALAAAIALVAWLAPTEKTLGEAVKMVYVHGAVIRVTLLTFVLSGVAGVGYLVVSREAWYNWSHALVQTGLLLWIVYVATSYVATMQTWGGIPTFEPRWVFTLQVLIAAPVFYGVSVWLKNPRVAALIYAALAGLILFLLSQAQLVLHPLDPIGEATTDTVRVVYTVLLVLCGLFAMQLARGMRLLRRPKSSR